MNVAGADWPDGRDLRSDPHGHLMAANEVGQVFGLDEIIFVPTGQPWQKSERTVSPAEDRYLMTAMATAANPIFSVSRVEIDRPGETYTVDTVRQLRAERDADAEFFFIIGADALSRLDTWHKPEELLELVHFIGCTRHGHQLIEGSLGEEKFACSRCPRWRSRRACAGNACATGLPIRYLVPDDVISYISKRGLYRD